MGASLSWGSTSSPFGAQRTYDQAPSGFSKVYHVPQWQTAPKKVSVSFVRSWRMSQAAPVVPRSDGCDVAASVLLTGVSAILCEDSVIEVMLEQAGLESVIETFTWTTKGKEGEIMVRFSSQHAAFQCIEHFDGRKWGGCVLSAFLMTPE